MRRLQSDFLPHVPRETIARWNGCISCHMIPKPFDLQEFHALRGEERNLLRVRLRCRTKKSKLGDRYQPYEELCKQYVDGQMVGG